MAYGILKVDTVTFTDASSDKSVSISGLVKNPTFSGNVTATGTISGATIQGGTLVSGATVTGSAGQFTTLTAVTGVFASGTAAAPSISVGTTTNGIYSPGTNQVAISTSGTGRVFVTSDGKVGIGTSSPAYKLDVAGSGTQTIRALTTDTSGVAIGAFRAEYQGGGGGANTAVDLRAGDAYAYLATVTNHPLLFGTNGAERARIDSSGRLLVGISSVYNVPTGDGGIRSPGFQRAATTFADSSISSMLFNTVAGGGGTLQLGRSNTTTIGAQAIAASGDIAGAVYFSASDGTTQTRLAQIIGVVDGTPGPNDMPGRLIFSTTADGASAPTERMRITNAGNILIGRNYTGNEKIGLGGGTSTYSTGTSAAGIYDDTVVSAAQTNSYAGVLTYVSTAAAAFTLGNLTHFNASQGVIGAGSSITNQYGFFVQGTLTGATNNYGFYGNIPSGTGRWNFYASGTALNYFAGNVGIAKTPGVALDVEGPIRSTQGTIDVRLQAGAGGAAGVGTFSNDPLLIVVNGTERARFDSSGNMALGSSTAAGYAFLINKALTGALTSYGIVHQGTVQSDATSNASYFTTAVSTQAATFTVGNIYHYQATQGTIGAGSTVTNQIGFAVGASLTGATNNYGFFSNIPSGTGRWNFYAANTANNYFAGNVGIGVTTPSFALEVVGTAGVRPATSNCGFLSLYGNSGAAAGCTVESSFTSGGYGPLIFKVNNAEASRIDSSGRLLVGTSASRGAHTFEGTDYASSSVIVAINKNTVDMPFLQFIKSRGAATGSVTAVQNGDYTGGIEFVGADGSTATAKTAGIYSQVDGAPGINDMPGRIVLSTTLDGASTPTEQWRINNAGTVIYNQPAPAAVNTTATLTVANLTAKIITSTTAAAVTMTLPTGTDMDAGFSGLYTNMAFEWYVINTGATNAVTVQANTGHTIVGSATVAASNSGKFLSRRTAANTWVTYRLSS